MDHMYHAAVPRELASAAQPTKPHTAPLSLDLPQEGQPIVVRPKAAQKCE
jgi:hypothetical protein